MEAYTWGETRKLKSSNSCCDKRGKSAQGFTLTSLWQQATIYNRQISHDSLPR